MSDATNPKLSYRALLALPGVKRVAVAQTLGPLATQASTLTVILLMLDQFQSPGLAGIAGFLSESGLVFVALAGGLVESAGIKRLIFADYVVSATVALLLAGLAATDTLNLPTALILVTVFGLTGPLSVLGLRTVLPRSVPEDYLDRANALTFITRALGRIIGPVTAALLSEAYGPEWSLLFCGLLYVVGAVVVTGFQGETSQTVAEPFKRKRPTDGVRETLRNPMLRNVSFFTAVGFTAGGAMYGAMPALVKGSLAHAGAVIAMAYFVFAAADIVSGLVFGRIQTAGREWLIMSTTICLYGIGFLVMALDSAAAVVVGAALAGIAETPMDQGVYGARQRAVDETWLASVTAVALSVDFGSFAIGIAITGILAQWSPSGALTIAAAVCVASAMIPVTLIRPLSTAK